VRQECPACHKMQIPRVDILNPTNNVEGHIAFLTEVCVGRLRGAVGVPFRVCVE